jgi:glutathione S-transferase
LDQVKGKAFTTGRSARRDRRLSSCESGAGLLHLARKSEKLMPRDASGEAETLQWVIAALNSIEMVTVPWWFGFSKLSVT